MQIRSAEPHSKIRFLGQHKPQYREFGVLNRAQYSIPFRLLAREFSRPGPESNFASVQQTARDVLWWAQNISILRLGLLRDAFVCL